MDPERSDCDELYSDVQDVATVKFRVNCRFDSKSGAALVMYKPQLSSLPRDERVVRLLKEFHILKGKYIVTEVTSCPAYILVMSIQGTSWAIGPRHMGS